MHNPGVLQLGEKIDVWNGPPFSMAAKAFVGRDSRGADVSAGVVTSKSLGYAHANAVAYVYNNSQNSAALYVNGKVAAESSAPTSVAVTSRKVIGKHGIFDQWYFRGDLSELVIFNSALRPTEVKSVSSQLMKFYGVAEQSDAIALPSTRSNECLGANLDTFGELAIVPPQRAEYDRECVRRR